MKNSISSLFLALLLVSPAARGSETRIDGTGGLSLVLQDETTDLDPFTFGNPAGLAVLQDVGRFDYSGEWLKNSWGNDEFPQTHLYGTLTGFQQTPPRYEGLILPVNGNWKVQVDAGVFSNEGDNSPSVFQIQNEDLTEMFFRTSYQLGPIVLGAEIGPDVTNTTLPQQPFNGNTIQSGTGNLSSVKSKFGALVSFPEGARVDQERLELGGSFQTQVSPASERDNLVVTPSLSSTPVNLVNTLTATKDQIFGPEAYFSSPGAVEIAAAVEFSNLDLSTGLESSDPGTIAPEPTAKLETESTTGADVAFKVFNHFSDGVTWESGINFLFSSTSAGVSDTYLNPTPLTSSQTTESLSVGTGLEKTSVYGVGLQVEGLIASGGVSTTNGLPVHETNFYSYKVILGGEKWLTTDWAIRMGFSFEDDFNNGDQTYQTTFYPVPVGTRITTPFISGGVGYKSNNLYADFAGFVGEPMVFDSEDGVYSFLTAIQLAAGITF